MRGFTLLELAITLAIASILLGLALPSMRSIVGDSEISTTVNELVFALQTARSEAIKRAAPVVLCASASPTALDALCDGAGYADGWIVFADSNGNGTREPGVAAEESILQTESPGPAFTFTAETTVAERVLFVGDGSSATPAGTPISGRIRVAHPADDHDRVVVVGANGRVSSEVVP